MNQALKLVAVAALLTAPIYGAVAQSDQRIVVPLSDPGRPATLEVSLVFGSIAITAYDGDEIVIVPHESADGSANRSAGDAEDADRGGLHRIPNTSLGLTAVERDNTVSIAVDLPRRGVQLEISVPRRTSVHAGTVNGGPLTVEGVVGEHELSNVNGRISATDIGGSVVANTTNGDAEISFTELTPDKAMSFTSFNGNIEVTFPGSLAADLRISSGRGDVLTDFDVEVQPQAPVVDRSDEGGRYRVRLERDVRATVGGGGPEMYFKSFNGDIIIRRR